MRILIILLVVFVLAALAWSNRPVTIPVSGRVPNNFPVDGFAHDSFEALLQEFVTASGDVDYETWHGDEKAIARLDNYLAAVGTFSPDATPERFDSKNDKLAYWMYGYNANVIRSVLANWPLNSVTEVKAPIEAVKGLGFFYRNRYYFGGKAYSLLSIENQKIRKGYRDPRIHFVLNCASESCPVIRPQLPTGDELEGLLAQAEQEFLEDSANVQVDHDARVIRLSAIFKMYESDFRNHMRASGYLEKDGLLAYLRAAAPAALCDDFDAARNYDIEFRDFDWQINAAD